MEVMHIDNVVATFGVDVLAKLLNVDALGRSLHHNRDNVLDNRQSCPDDDEREEVCAEGVSVPS